MDIQPATLADAEDLAWLGNRMQSESAVRFPEIDRAAIDVHLQMATDNPGRIFMGIARDGAVPVGLVGGVIGVYAFSAELRACCDTLFVRADYRGRYSGVRLLRAFDAWAVRHGAMSIYLGISTGISPDRTARLLAHLGYRTLGQTFRKEIDICVPA